MRILKKISDEFWWDVLRKCEYATFYHTPIWKELAERAFPGVYRNETCGAIFPSGVRAVLPMVSKRRFGPLRWLESTYEGCYGGIIADGPVSQGEAVELYRQACSWPTASLYSLENPLAQRSQEELESQFACTVKEVVYELKLDSDFDTIFAQFSRTQRNAYRKGIKKGVQIRQACSLDDYQAYYTNYRDAVDRWGEGSGYGYSWNLFEQLYSLSQVYPDNIKLWLMIVDQRIVGGRIVFYWGRQATGWNGTAHRDYLQYDVMPVADTEIIRDAITQGYEYFDFNTSGLNEGVMRYKERFSPTAKPIYGWFYEHPLIPLTRAIYARGQQVLGFLSRPRSLAQVTSSTQKRSAQHTQASHMSELREAANKELEL